MCLVLSVFTVFSNEKTIKNQGKKMTSEGIQMSIEKTKNVVELPLSPEGSTAVGDDCTNPIVVTFPAAFPYTNTNTTNGRGNEYSNTVLGSYDSGPDIIYQFVVTTTTAMQITLTPIGTYQYAGIGLFSGCPDASNNIAYATASSGPMTINIVNLAAGTYYFMADNWPTPDYIDFTLNVTPPAPGADCSTAFSYGNVCGPAVNGTLVAGASVWYSFTTPANMMTTVSLCAGASMDTKLDIYAACGSALLFTNDDFCGLLSQISCLQLPGGQTYYARVYGYSSSTAGPFTITITCVQPPVVDLGDDISVCDGVTVTLDAGFPGATYLWSTGDMTQTIDVTSSGTYSVTVTNDCGTDDDEVVVTVYTLPAADAGNDVTIYIGYPPLSAQLNASGGVSCEWSPPDGLSDPYIYNPVASPGSTTTYTLTVTDANGCTNSDVVTVEVCDVRCGKKLNMVQVTNNANVPLCLPPRAVPPILNNGGQLGPCQTRTSILLGEEDLETSELFSVSVYPNPFENICNIVIAMDQTSAATVRIVDLLGRIVSKVYEGQLSQGNHNFTWDREVYTNTGSIYYLQVITDKDLRTVKLFVK